jgi:hypothetical protein
MPIYLPQSQPQAPAVRRQRTGGRAPEVVSGHGEMEIGFNDEGFVVVQFQNPEWWMNLTPEEARMMSRLLMTKAGELEEYIKNGSLGPSVPSTGKVRRIVTMKAADS